MLSCLRYGSRALLPLRSFPTRRSSDLNKIPAPTAEPKRDIIQLVFMALGWCGWVSVCVMRVGLDRKSTRLNSSHVAISYAVFCLKKKEQTGNALGAIMSFKSYSHREPR